MADLKISALPRKAALASNDLIPIVDLQFGASNYVNKKTTIGDIVTIVSNTVIDATGLITSVNGQTGTVVIGVNTLADTQIQTPLGGDVLRYDAATGKWLNTSLSDYAPLVSGKIPSEYLPGYVDDVIEAATFSALPNPGETGKIYVTLDTNKSYRWGGTVYVEISRPAASTDDVPEGVVNLYYKDDRVSDVIDAWAAGTPTFGGIFVGADMSFGATGIAGWSRGFNFEEGHIDGNWDVYGTLTFNQPTIGISYTDLNNTPTSLEWTAGTVPQTEAEAGTATTRRAWTALRVRQAFDAFWTSKDIVTYIDNSKVTAQEFTVRGVDQGVYSDNTVIPAGTSLETIIRNMLQKVVPPVYVQPTLAISTSTSPLVYEYGYGIKPVLDLIWTKNDAGNATTFRYKQDGVTINTISGSSPSAIVLDEFELTTATTFTADADYGTGAQKNDNFGNPSGTPISAGTVNAGNSITFTPLYSRYWGVSSSANITDAEILTLNSDMPLAQTRVQTRNDFTPNAQYIYIVFSASFDPTNATIIKFNGFVATGSWVRTVRDFTNASGYTSSYHIWRTNFTQNSPDIDIEVL